MEVHVTNVALFTLASLRNLSASAMRGGRVPGTGPASRHGRGNRAPCTPGQPFMGGPVPSRGGVMSQTCPMCKHPDGNIVTDYTAGDVICCNCGFVIGDHVIDDSIEWRTFADGNAHRGDPNRCGGRFNVALGSAGLVTELSKGPSGSVDDPLARCHNRLKSKTDRALKDTMTNINQLGARLGLPNRVLQRALGIYTQALSAGVQRRQSPQVATASVLYAACRVEGVTRSIKEVAAKGGVAKKHVGKYFTELKAKLDLPVQTVKSTDFIARLCNILRVPMRTQVVAEHVAKAVSSRGVCHGRNPLSICAAAIWLTCQLTPARERVTLVSVSMACGITEGAVRCAYEDMHRVATSLLPHAFASRVDVSKLPHPTQAINSKPADVRTSQSGSPKKRPRGWEEGSSDRRPASIRAPVPDDPDIPSDASDVDAQHTSPSPVSELSTPPRSDPSKRRRKGVGKPPRRGGRAASGSQPSSCSSDVGAGVPASRASTSAPAVRVITLDATTRSVASDPLYCFFYQDQVSP